MKKIKPIRTRLGHRIANAVKALKGEPWPEQIAFELPKIERYKFQTFVRQHVCGRCYDEWAPVDMDKINREEIAAQLGKDLLQAGAIKITTEQLDPEVHGRWYGPFPGKIYRAKIRVVLPEEKEN